MTEVDPDDLAAAATTADAPADDVLATSADPSKAALVAPLAPAQAKGRHGPGGPLIRGQDDTFGMEIGVHDLSVIRALRAMIDQKPDDPLSSSVTPSGAGIGVTEDNHVGASGGDVTPSATANENAGGYTLRRPDRESIGRYRLTRVLGQGGFGRVYLAHDSVLDRDVAIKVPLHVEVSSFVDVEAYLREARILARLAHANIVPVYDVGRADDGLFFVVSKYMEGGDLASRISRGRPHFTESASIVAQLCDALHYTHTQDLFHRDIKPANILLDAAGVPYLADFGLALKDENMGKESGCVGTAAYMSPEQARGEGHRVDGRSDIFSMGIVFFELLTGRRPFRGGSNQEVMQQVISTEPRPPRQIDDKVPAELERICLKALAKRACERYSTARDLAEEIRHFLATTAITAARSELPAAAGMGSSVVSSRSDSISRIIRIVPKGLGSFNENDADFFLELLPGPRDRDGLPDSLRSWKTRIEMTDPDKTFRVGLIYGPSGCGKSSLVKAGLLPLLGRHVVPIYVESTGGETESRLLRGIHKRFSSLPSDLGLVGSLMLLRQGQGVEPGRKVLLVLDQFEQWLFATKGEHAKELVAALRQCDGEHVQAICLVRDDFWMAATRFMTDLEIDLVPDRNVAAVDLFDPKHTRKVLEAYGRAHEALPQRTGELSKEHRSFLDQAVAGLTQDGWVVPVRLALFAEMVKGRPWLPATLRELGGMDGVGVKFLEDTFSSARANPRHHFHQKAAQAVLKALLPETNTDIKGQMRPTAELREASGYADRPADFVDLIRILDNDLHLITPVDPEGSIDGQTVRGLSATEHSYQLTHDYLVHSLRDWLTRKQRETRRGRAQLRLATITSFWRDRPERRRLPSSFEWLDILCYTQRRLWSDCERRMMKSATWHYAVRGLAGIAIAIMVMVAANEFRGRTRAESLVSQLLVADTNQVSAIIKEMDGELARTRGELDRIAGDPRRTPKERLHATLALLPFDRMRDNDLLARLLDSGPDELIVITERLKSRPSPFLDWLWGVATDAAARREQKLRAACALAKLGSDGARWAALADPVAEALVLDENAFHLERWLDALRLQKKSLLEPVAKIFRNRERSDDERFRATFILVQFAAGEPEFLVKLIKDADPRQYAMLRPLLDPDRSRVIELLAAELDKRPLIDESEDTRNRMASQTANCAITLLLLGQPKMVWSLLEDSPDPLLRGFLIDRIEPLGVDPQLLIDRLKSEPDTAVRRALILILADYRGNRMSASARAMLELELLESLRTDPDPGIHSAAEFLLRRYGRGDQVDALSDRMRGEEPGPGRRWQVNREGDTMVVIDPRGKDKALSSSRPIDRMFAIATKEVTVAQYLRFRSEVDYEQTYAPTLACPMNCVSWYDAAAYCRWLSELEELPPEEMCYPPIEEIKEGMRLPHDYLRRTGYRLPTEAEAEYACRAGTVTSRFFGSADSLLAGYAYFRDNSQNHAWPVGSKRPNDLGLFDILGNMLEWCQESRSAFGRSEDSEDTDAVSNQIERVVHSGSFDKVIDLVKSDRSEHALPAAQYNSIGFRIARTVRPRP